MFFFGYSHKSCSNYQRETASPHRSADSGPSRCEAVNIPSSTASCCSALALNLASSRPLVPCLTLNYHVSKTALTLRAADDMFNDAWVSALRRGLNLGATQRAPPPNPSAGFGPRQMEEGPWEPFVSRPWACRAALVLLHFSVQVLKERFLKMGAAICTAARGFK